MPISINSNLMAANVANNLNSHYGRLAASVERLSSGLRINSAADDAAGLAIRELMRADVAAFNQGVRNANDAISMVQVADGALAIIDEKLIRMKELAEQAATGTYNSTQRLIIDSEYQAMADEIDRIARATNFNGIHLLDGSLSGKHNGAGLQAQGAMKIHFGSANDSAEDYYYVAIGDCTAAALGLGASAMQSGEKVTWTKVETTKEVVQTFTPQTTYDVFVSQYGTQYYKGKDFYFSNLADPYGSRLDETTHSSIIANLRQEQEAITTTIYYKGYVDPDTGTEYYYGNMDYTSDPYDPIGKRLDDNKPEDKAILDRLVVSPTAKVITVKIGWDTWKDSQGKKFYSYNGGLTLVPNTSQPSSNILDRNDPADQPLIDALEPVYGTKAISLPDIETWYSEWEDPLSKKMYYSADGGVTFVSDVNNPLGTLLDSVRDGALIARLVTNTSISKGGKGYNTYLDAATNTLYYSRGNQIWFVDPNDPSKGKLDINNAGDSLIIASLQPVIDNKKIHTTCAVYQDITDSSKLFYSRDNGKTFFTDVSNPLSTEFSASDPAYAAVVANLKKVTSTVTIEETFVTHWDKITGRQYFTRDGGRTFYADPNDLTTLLDPADAGSQVILGRLELYPTMTHKDIAYYCYRDPQTGKTYYSPDKSRSYFYDNFFADNPAIFASNPADKPLIDRLEEIQNTKMGKEKVSKFPELTIYSDTRGRKFYYSHDGGKTISSYAHDTYDDFFRLDPDDSADKAILDTLKPAMVTKTITEYIKHVTNEGVVLAAGATISTQQAAQLALGAIDRAIVSKDKIRAHLGAMQNRLENTVTNLTIQSENLQTAESRISDTDIATEMTTFVRNQVLTQSAVAMLGQANSYPHMLSQLING